MGTPCSNSNYLQFRDRSRSQNSQSAAPPAMVAIILSVIGSTFFTLFEDMYPPIVDLESTDRMMPPLKMNPSVVVPCYCLIVSTRSGFSPGRCGASVFASCLKKRFGAIFVALKFSRG